MYDRSSTKVLFLMMFLLFSTNLSFSQEEETLSNKERKAEALEQIKKLHSGTLVVRLPSNAKKIAALQGLIDRGKLKKKAQRRTVEKLETTKKSTRSFNLTMMQALKENYHFSELLFIYDTASVALKNGQYEGIFLNDSLAIDPDIELKNDTFLGLRFGNTKSEDGQSIDAMVVMNRQLKDLSPPFPYYVRMNNIFAILGTFLPEQSKVSIVKATQKLNARLNSFYRRYY